VTCRGVAATRNDRVMRQGTETFPAYPFISGLSTGLGSIAVTVQGGGAHFVGVFVDHEIDEAVNGFANEYGIASYKATGNFEACAT
jgi:hypothetical protein